MLPPLSGSSPMPSTNSSGISILNYQLGEPLGKGASASVFKALNWATGETVAVKQISLSDVIGKAELQEIMSEIDLLKNLNHPNIVEYKGFFQNEEYLFIILEYCENGSLQSITKRYGKFPEELVALYVSQVLSGLIYLHSQGVIHRDIKGANILTNKDGSVKLADFGVATMMTELGGGLGQMDGNGGNGDGSGKVKIGVGEGAVVGSPYWMAPEVIEQNGATTASDIWSLGCVVIELLEGRPPYYNLDPMQALFRIVQDDGPPIPEGATLVVKDFLGQCFQKDPNLRISAQQLISHAWLAKARKEEDSIQARETERIEVDVGPISSNNNKMVTRDLLHGIVRTEEPRLQIKSGPKSAWDRQKPSKIERSLTSEPGNSQPRLTRAISSATPIRIKAIRRLSSSQSTSESERPNESETSTSISRPASALSHRISHGLKGKEKSQELGEIKSELKYRPKRPLTTVYAQAVQKVQEWNEALASKAGPSRLPTTSTTSSTGSANKPAPRPLRRRPNAFDASHESKTPIENPNGIEPSSSGESLAKHLAALTPSGFKSRPTGREEGMEVLADETESNWDDDFADAEVVGGKLKKGQPIDGEDLDAMKTIMPKRSASSSGSISGSMSDSIRFKSSLPASLTRMAAGRVPADDEDFSDLDVGDAKSLREKIASMQKSRNTSGGLFHPKDIRNISFSSVSAASRSPPPVIGARRSSGDLLIRPRLASPGSMGNLVPGTPSRTTTYHFSSPEAEEQMLRTERNLKKYAEDEEEDFDEVFTNPKMKMHKTDSLKLNTIRSNRSTEGKDEFDIDPFAQIDDSLLEYNQEDHLRKERHAMLCGKVSTGIEELQPTHSERMLENATKDLVTLLEDNSDLQQHFVLSHGLQAALEVLEMTSSEEVKVNLLRILYIAIQDSDASLENLCLIGGVSIILEFCARRHSVEARLQSLSFVHRLIATPTGLPILTSCGGLKILVRLLGEDYRAQREIVVASLSSIHQIITLQKGSSKVDLCRSLTREGILDTLAQLLDDTLRDNSNEAEDARIASTELINTFCQAAQTDLRLRSASGTRRFVNSLVHFAEELSGTSLLNLCKAVKHMCTHPSTMDMLQSCGMIPSLVALLDQHSKSNNTNEISSQIYQALYNLCRLSSTRQEEAAQAGLIPLLKQVIQKGSPMKAWALPIFCDLASAGQRARKLLWKVDALKLYVKLMEDPYWRLLALEAIVYWLTEESSAVESALLTLSFATPLLAAFSDASGIAFETMLNSLLKLFRFSRRISMACARSTFYRRVTDGLKKEGKAVVKVNLLKALRMVIDNSPDLDVESSAFRDMRSSIDRLGQKDDAILVRKLATEMLGLIPAKPKNGTDRSQRPRNVPGQRE